MCDACVCLGREGRKVEGYDEAALRDAIYCCKEWTGGAWGGRKVCSGGGEASSKVQVRREQKSTQ